MSPYILIVTGSREAQREDVWPALSGVVERNGKPFRLIHGGCRGTDLHADLWAKHHGVQPVRLDALWDSDGRGPAGPMRNQRIIDDAQAMERGLFVVGRPHALRAVAFPAPHSRGTVDMMERLKVADVPTLVKAVT